MGKWYLENIVKIYLECRFLLLNKKIDALITISMLFIACHNDLPHKDRGPIKIARQNVGAKKKINGELSFKLNRTNEKLKYDSSIDKITRESNTGSKNNNFLNQNNEINTYYKKEKLHSKKSKNNKIIKNKKSPIQKNDKETTIKSNNKKNISGFNIYGKCSKCHYQRWLHFGYGSFNMSLIQHARECEKCHKEADMIIYKLLGIGPSKYKYCFALCDNKNEKIVKRNSGIINDKHEVLFDFLLKYSSYSYGVFTFSSI